MFPVQDLKRRVAIRADFLQVSSANSAGATQGDIAKPGTMRTFLPISRRKPLIKNHLKIACGLPINAIRTRISENPAQRAPS